MPSFSQIRDMYRLQKQAKQIKKELKNIHVEAEGSAVKVVVSAEMEIISIEIASDADVVRLASTLTDVLNRALKKAQIVSAEKMQGVMGQLGLNGQDQHAA